MPLQPLNLNRDTSVDYSGKKGGHRDCYGYKPSPVVDEPETPSRDHNSLPEPETIEYSTAPPYFTRQSYYYHHHHQQQLQHHHRHEEEHPYSGYLEDDLECIPPPPPPPATQHHHVTYHYGPPPPPLPPPPPPPPSYENTATFAASRFPYSTGQYSPADHSLATSYSPHYHRMTTPVTDFESPSAETPRSATPRSPGELQELDIVCGRGAPTNYHYGNQVFKQVIEQYQTAYLCAKRSDKPHLAMKIMDIIKDGGARFVKREKTAGHFSWVEIDSKGAYEKVCQALRDGAPEVRRKALSASQKKESTSSND